MKLKNTVLTIGLASAVLVAAPVRAASSAPQTTAVAVDDSAIKTLIVANIKKDATISERDVDVSVTDGVATLKGTVRTASEKGHAAMLANVKGVKSVNNELMIDATATKSRADKAADATKKGVDKAIDATAKAGEKTVEVTKDAAKATGEKTKDIAEGTAKKTKEAASATGEAVTDGWITTRLKSKFVDEKLLKDSDINVDTNDHIVTLKGTVLSTAGKARAESIASGTEGVKRVINQLVVTGS